MNADVSDASSLFGKHLMHFCIDSGLILPSKVLLPENSYTYSSKAWHTTFWLDHYLCTHDAHDSIEKMEIVYDLATTDHITRRIVLNTGNLPVDSSVISGKINWAELTNKDLDKSLMPCWAKLGCQKMHYCVET